MKHSPQEWLGFLFKTFTVPLSFFVVFKLYGSKPAISVAILAAFSQGAFERWNRRPLSPFFLVGSFFTLLLGGLDLLGPHPQYYRFEPFAHNLVIALIFLGATLRGFLLLEWFAQGLPTSFRPEMTPELRRYFFKVTWAWIAYLLAKAFFFLWLSSRVDLGELMLIRSIGGGATLVLMVGGEMVIRRIWFRT